MVISAGFAGEIGQLRQKHSKSHVIRENNMAHELQRGCGGQFATSRTALNEPTTCRQGEKCTWAWFNGNKDPLAALETSRVQLGAWQAS